MFTPLERLLNALLGARRSGKGWSARCPAHDDRRASLSIAEGDDGRVLVHCHAGCTPDAICAAAGLSVTDLFPNADQFPVNRVNVNCKRSRPANIPTPLKPIEEPAGKPTGKIFATAREAVAELERRNGPRSALWTYRDASAAPVGVVVRWNLPDGKKDIRPVSRHDDGWRIGAMPEPRPLYCLPDLAAASRVYVCEGEKAADAVRSLGLVATTSSGGALAARKTNWRPLAATDIIVLPDNDEPGERYAADVADECHAAGARSVRIIRLCEHATDLPAGGDIADILADERWCGLELGGESDAAAILENLAGPQPRVAGWNRAECGTREDRSKIRNSL